MVQNDKPIVKFLNIMVLLSSILVLVIISIELLSATTILSERFILNTHLMVCTIFLADFFVRWSTVFPLPELIGNLYGQRLTSMGIKSLFSVRKYRIR